MARKYDIIERLKAKNERPFIMIDEDHVFNVDSSKTTVMAIMAISTEQTNDDPIKNIETLDKIIQLALGQKALDYINSLDLSLDACGLIVEAIMSAITGSDLEEEKEEKK